MRSDIDALTKPEVQAGLRAAKFMDPNIGDMNPKWLSTNTKAALEGSKALAKDKIQGIGRVLGVGAHANDFSRSLLREWGEKAGTVIDDPIFKEAANVTDLGKAARTAADRVWEKGTKLLEKYKDDLALSPEDVIPRLKAAAEQVEELRLSAFTTPMAEGRSGAMLQSLQDMQKIAERNGGRLDPVSASIMVKDLNKYRRDVLREFDKATQGGLAQGQSALKDIDATESLAEISNALNGAISDKVAKSGKIPMSDKEVLSNFRAKYGGYSTVDDAVNEFVIRKEAGASSKDAGKLVGPAGKPETSGDYTKPSMTKAVVDKVLGDPDVPVSPSTSAYLRAQDRDRLGMQAVRDVQTMVESPEIQIPAVSASPRQLKGQLLGREAAMTGAGLAAPLAAAGVREYSKASPAQAEMTTPLDSYISPDPYENGLPRDSSAWNDETIARAIVDSATSPKRPIVEQLAVKFKEALRAEDQSKSERILADLAKIAPELFEPCRGSNGRLFHKDEQKEYLDRLHKAYRDGTISADFMHKQQKAFDDPTNSLILPLELPQAQWKAKARKGQQAAGKSPRGLLGGVYAQIGPARQTGSVPGGQYGQFDIAPGMAPRVGPRY
jgi:hypothetical protein